ncbi:hypothetical protein ES708_06120 [subsurface metagenome]
MSNISTYLEEKWLNMLKGTAYTAPATVYCGIVEYGVAGDYDDELEAGTLTHEISGYTGDRKAITLGEVSQVGGAGSAGKATVKNSAAVEFESMPAPDTKKVGYAIVCDAATAGNILYWCPLVAEKSWNEGDTFRIPIDGLVLDLA